jgi:hypothetical protein
VTNTDLEFELKARVASRERHVCAVGRGGRGHGAARRVCSGRAGAGCTVRCRALGLRLLRVAQGLPRRGLCRLGTCSGRSGRVQRRAGDAARVLWRTPIVWAMAGGLQGAEMQALRGGNGCQGRSTIRCSITTATCSRQHARPAPAAAGPLLLKPHSAAQPQGLRYDMRPGCL